MCTLTSPISQVAPLPRYSILFSEPDDSLPEPLPTLDAIEDAPVITEKYSRHVAIVGNSYAVKYGYRVESLEADNMRFVRQNTSVSVPRVYAVYQRFPKEGGQITYIIMDRVAGKSLDKLWHGLDASQKMEIVQQLKESFDAIRDLPGPGFFGSIDRTKPRDFFFDFDEPMPSLDGPFHTEEALINGLVDRYLAEDPERRRCESEYYRKHLMKQLKGDGQSVFTHGDLQLKNIMLQPNGRIIIIDWATSGWYPVYWEYIVAICAHGGWTNDWHSHIHLFLDEYPNHYVWMNRLLLDRYY